MASVLQARFVILDFIVKAKSVLNNQQLVQIALQTSNALVLIYVEFGMRGQRELASRCYPLGHIPQCMDARAIITTICYAVQEFVIKCSMDQS